MAKLVLVGSESLNVSVDEEILECTENNQVSGGKIYFLVDT